jgi:hypothetical protein
MAPINTRPEPTETSPLLGKPNGQTVDPANGLTAVEPEPYDETDVEDNDNEPDLERQPSNGETFKHQGLPEVRKRMKYIFPAIAIGVSSLCRKHQEQLLIRYRSSSLLQTRLSSSRPMVSSVRI